MNKILKSLAIALSVCGLLCACEESDDNHTALQVSGISAEALPGAIELRWQEVNDDNFLYSEMSYYDFGKQKTVTKKFSRYATSCRIDSLLNRYGDYTFVFTSYDVDGNQGQPVSISRQCQKATAYYVTKEENKIALTEAQLSTNAQEPSEGPIANLIDGDLNTYFQSFWDEWSFPELKPAGYHNVAFDFRKDVTAIRFQYWNRKKGGSLPQKVNLYGSTDGESWRLIQQLENLPSDPGSSFSSDLMLLDDPISHLKFEVIEGTDIYNLFFCIAEIEFYEVVRELVDPEQE